MCTLDVLPKQCHDMGEEEGAEEDDYDGGNSGEVGSRHISKER